MKFLIEDARTKTALDTSNPDTIILSHFLWAVGQPLEKNIKGILCSLLYQLLLRGSTFSKKILERFPSTRHKRSPSDWPKEELMNVIIDTFTVHSRHFCIFLDGLDEIDPRDGQTALIGLIDDLCTNPQLRMCLSSRPEPALQRRFGSCPMLRVQDLTRNDIYRYAEETLAEVRLAEENLRQELVRTVCEKAHGVFLWAALALRSIQTGWSHGDDAIEIKQRLELLPDDLNALYEDMWQRLNDSQAIYQMEAAQYFNLMLEKQSIFWEMSLGILTLAFQPSLATAVLAKENTCSPREFVQACCRTSSRLQTRCAGILEISKSGLVTFIHRSAAEFLTGTPEGQRICQVDQSSSEARLLSLIRGHLGCVKLMKCSASPPTPYCSTDELVIGAFRTLWTIRHSLVDPGKLSENGQDEVIRYSRTLYETDQWGSWPQGMAQPDFPGITAYAGLLAQTAAEFKRLVSETPDNMRISGNYKAYLLGAAYSGSLTAGAFPANGLETLHAVLGRPVLPSKDYNHIGFRWMGTDQSKRPYYTVSDTLTDFIMEVLYRRSTWSDVNVLSMLLKLEPGCNLLGRTVITVSRVERLSDEFDLNQFWTREFLPHEDTQEAWVFEVPRSFFRQLYLRLATAHMRTPVPSHLSDISLKFGGSNAPMTAKPLAVIIRCTQDRTWTAETEILVPSAEDSTDFTMECLGTASFESRRPKLRVAPAHRLPQILDRGSRSTLNELEQSLVRAGHFLPWKDAFTNWPPKPYSPEARSN